MQTQAFSNGDTIPMLGLGTWKSEPGQVYTAVLEAIKLGFRHIDCAAIYLNEKEVGEAISKAISEGIVKREELWITSKLWNSAHLKDDVRPALEQTLADLQLDYVDLYLMHWPVALKPGVLFPSSEDDFLTLEEIPIEVTWSALEECMHAGLSRHIGVSNFSVKKIEELLGKCSIRPEVNQIEMHPFLQQNQMMEYCHKENILLTAYSPLGSIDRPERFKAPDEPSLLENPTIVDIAKNIDATPAQVLIRWAIQRGTIVIPKSVNPGRMKLNLDATSLELSEEDMKRIARLDFNGRYIVGGFWVAPEKGYTLENLWDE